MRIKIVLIFFITIVIAFSSAFVIVNWNKVFPNNDIEQELPEDNDENEDGGGTETPDGNEDGGGTETPDDNEENEEPIQPGENFTINISKNHIKF